MKQYKSPKEAENASFGHHLSPHNTATGNKNATTQCSSTHTDPPTASTIKYPFKQLPLDSQLQGLSDLFSTVMSIKFSNSVPDDYLCL